MARFRLGLRGWAWLVVIVATAVVMIARPHWARQFGLDPEQMSALPVAGGDFELSDGTGPWRLSRHVGDHTLVLLYFGFTRCPDLCPTTLTKVARGIRAMSPARQKRVMAVFVSVDHQSDTPAQAAEYAKAFGPEFTGLSGDKAAIDRVTRQFDAAYVFTPLPKSAMKYTVDHTGFVYVLDRNGVVLQRVQLDREGTDVKAVMERYL